MKLCQSGLSNSPGLSAIDRSKLLVKMRPHRLLLPAAILLFSTSVTPCHALLLLLSPLHQHHVHRQKTIIKTPPSSPQMPGLFSTALSSTISKQDEKPAIASIDGCKNSGAINKEELVKELGAAFTHKLFELEEYRRKNGDCLVPKRYESNPSLGNWVNKQRQNYRKFFKGEKTSMNEVCCWYVLVCRFNWNVKFSLH